MLGAPHPECQRFIASHIDPSDSGMLPILLFASGLQASPTDLQAVGDSGTWSAGAQAVTPAMEDRLRWRPIGTRVLRMLGDHARQERAVFLDSGAFSAFAAASRRKVPVPDVPWHQVLALYEDLLADVPRPQHRRLYLVAPDIVGDLDATGQLWARYAGHLSRYAASGAQVIFPLQRAQLGLLGGQIERAAAAWAQARQIAGTKAIAGFPFSRAAWTLDEVQELCRQVSVPRAHLLGIASPRRITEVVTFLERTLSLQQMPDLSADAAVVRSMVGTAAAPTPVRKRIAVRTYHLASERVAIDADDAEIYDQLDGCRTQARREVLAEALSLPLGTYLHEEPIAYREAPALVEDSDQVAA